MRWPPAEASQPQKHQWKFWPKGNEGMIWWWDWWSMTLNYQIDKKISSRSIGRYLLFICCYSPLVFLIPDRTAPVTLFEELPTKISRIFLRVLFWFGFEQITGTQTLCPSSAAERQGIILVRRPIPKVASGWRDSNLVESPCGQRGSMWLLAHTFWCNNRRRAPPE